jgi:hypothetical protein
VQPAHNVPDFLAAHDALADWRDAQHAELGKRDAARATIADPTTRQIADMFSASERNDVHLGHLSLLRSAVFHHPEGAKVPGASERVQAAFERVRTQGNYSAVEGLARELDRDRDDEEMSVILALMDA